MYPGFRSGQQLYCIHENFVLIPTRLIATIITVISFQDRPYCEVIFCSGSGAGCIQNAFHLYESFPGWLDIMISGLCFLELRKDHQYWRWALHAYWMYGYWEPGMTWCCTIFPNTTTHTYFSSNPTNVYGVTPGSIQLWWLAASLSGWNWF